jgi:AcrR family transcriptional regulator
MNERSRDPRTLRTTASLQAALREALSTRSLDEVNVSELCRVADVRRTTFYTHYESVAALLTEMLTGEIDALLDVAPVEGRSIAVVSAEFQDTLAAAFELVTRERHLFRVAFASDASTPLRRALLTMFWRRVEIALTIWHSLGAAGDADAVVAPAFAAGGLAASVEAWALSDETDSACWAAAVRDQMPPWWPRG